MYGKEQWSYAVKFIFDDERLNYIFKMTEFENKSWNAFCSDLLANGEVT